MSWDAKRRWRAEGEGREISPANAIGEDAGACQDVGPAREPRPPPFYCTRPHRDATATQAPKKDFTVFIVFFCMPRGRREVIESFLLQGISEFLSWVEYFLKYFSYYQVMETPSGCMYVLNNEMLGIAVTVRFLLLKQSIMAPCHILRFIRNFWES